MKTHESGTGAERLAVYSYDNGGAYSFNLGNGQTPCTSYFFQGDDASLIEKEYDTLSEKHPDQTTDQLWLQVINPYLI